MFLPTTVLVYFLVSQFNNNVWNTKRHNYILYMEPIDATAIQKGPKGDKGEKGEPGLKGEPGKEGPDVKELKEEVKE